MRITLQSQVDKSTSAEAQVREYTPKERSTRALKVLGGFWAGSLASIPVPVLHFVLLPGLFIAGPFMAWSQYKKEIKIESVAGTCPECKKDLTYRNISGSWPLLQICSHCAQQIYLRPG